MFPGTIGVQLKNHIFILLFYDITIAALSEEDERSPGFVEPREGGH